MNQTNKIGREICSNLNCPAAGVTHYQGEGEKCIFSKPVHEYDGKTLLQVWGHLRSEYIGVSQDLCEKFAAEVRRRDKIDVPSMSKEIDELSEENEKLSNRVRELEAELSKERKESEALAIMRDGLSDKAELLEKKMLELVAELKLRKDSICEAAEHIDHYKHEVIKWHDKAKQESAANIDQEERVNKLRAEIEGLKNKWHISQEHLRNAVAKHIGLTNQLQDSQKLIESQKAEIERLNWFKLQVERLKEELSDAEMEIEWSKIEIKHFRAQTKKWRETRTDALNDAIQEAARILPDGFVVHINVENGCGWVTLSDPHGEEIDMNADSSLAEQVRDAINAAMKGAE